MTHAARSHPHLRVVALALLVGTFFVAQEALTDLALGRPLRSRTTSKSCCASGWCAALLTRSCRSPFAAGRLMRSRSIPRSSPIRSSPRHSHPRKPHHAQPASDRARFVRDAGVSRRAATECRLARVHLGRDRHLLLRGRRDGLRRRALSDDVRRGAVERVGARDAKRRARGRADALQTRHAALAASAALSVQHLECDLRVRDGGCGQGARHGAAAVNAAAPEPRRGGARSAVEE